jgi:hypothetical protein
LARNLFKVAESTAEYRVSLDIRMITNDELETAGAFFMAISRNSPGITKLK